MSFKMRPEIDEWFARIMKGKGSPLATKFDCYYICLMMGFAGGKVAHAANAVEFVSTFINDYRPAQNFILGLLVAAEAHIQGVELADRTAVKRLLALYVSPEPSVGLTNEGFQRMNEYANGGFNAIVATYPEPPWIAADFLDWYLRAIQSAIDVNPWWEGMSNQR